MLKQECSGADPPGVHYPESVTLVEVAPRDGLQNEKQKEWVPCY